jgi:hypothetical protein
MPTNGPSGQAGGPARRGLDLAAFVAVLVVGVILIAAARVDATLLAAYSTTVAALYAAWRRR